MLHLRALSQNEGILDIDAEVAELHLAVLAFEIPTS